MGKIDPKESGTDVTITIDANTRLDPRGPGEQGASAAGASRPEVPAPALSFGAARENAQAMTNSGSEDGRGRPSAGHRNGRSLSGWRWDGGRW